MADHQDRAEEKPTDTFTLLPADAPLPDRAQITSVAVVAFTARGNILAALMGNGELDIPGGHVDEEDADLEATARRETREEICATLEDDLQVVAVIQSSRMRNGKPTYMVNMAGTVKDLLPLEFAEGEKSHGRKEIAPADFIAAYAGPSFVRDVVLRACQLHRGPTAPQVREGMRLGCG